MAWSPAGPYVTPPSFWTNYSYGMPPSLSGNSNVWLPPFQQPFPPFPPPPPPPSFYEQGWSNVSQTNWHEPAPFRGQSRGGRWSGGHKRMRGGTNDRGVSSSQAVNSCSTQDADFNCCGKAYKTSSAYQSHLCTHKKCDVCEYTGSGKALKDHALLAHYIPDELKFDSPEDIRKWKEARKRNYPTATNVEKKQKLATGKRESGSVAETPLYRYINHIVNSDRGGRRGGGRGGRRPFIQRGGRQWRARGVGTNSRGHRDSRGYERNNDMAAGNDEGARSTLPLPVHASAVPGDIGCAEEGCRETPEEEGEEDGMCSGRQLGDPQPSGDTQGSSGFQGAAQQQGACGGVGRRKNASVRKMSKGQSGSREPFRKPTLLEKLLAAEIRKEQNTILQCIRYIVKKDFLRPNQLLEVGTT